MSAAVTVTLVGIEPARPPLERLVVDVTVRNEGAAPRWVLIPAALPQTAGGIDKLEQLTVNAGAARVTVGHFLGTGGRYALLLAPGARVTLRKLEIGWWRKEGATEVAFAIQFADDVALGGDAMARWFDGDPTVRGTVDADMDTARHTASRRSPGNREVPVSVRASRETHVKLAPR